MPALRKPSSHAKTPETFGHRLARLRAAAGFSQREFASEVGISQRVVAYYERPVEHPLTDLLPLFCQALGISADVLLGLRELPGKTVATDGRLSRRLKKIERLPIKERRKIVQLLDLVLERASIAPEAGGVPAAPAASARAHASRRSRRLQHA